MNRRQVLLAITDPAQVSSGLQPDRHSLMQPLWERAANVRFYQGKVTRAIPASILFTALASGSMAARGLHQQLLSTGVKSVIVALVVRTSTPPDPNVYALRYYRWDGTTVTLLS